VNFLTEAEMETAINEWREIAVAGGRERKNWRYFDGPKPRPRGTLHAGEVWALTVNMPTFLSPFHLGYSVDVVPDLREEGGATRVVRRLRILQDLEGVVLQVHVRQNQQLLLKQHSEVVNVMLGGGREVAFQHRAGAARARGDARDARQHGDVILQTEPPRIWTPIHSLYWAPPEHDYPASWLSPPPDAPEA